MINATAVIIGFLLCEILFLIIITIFAISIFKKLFIRRKAEPDPFYFSRLTAIGIVSFVFGNTLYKILLYPIQILISNGTYAIKYLTASSGLSPSDFDLMQVNASIMKFYELLPVGKFLLAIAIGIVIYKLLIYFYTLVSSPAGSDQRSNALLYNLLILFILGFSLFLVISVFITIPYLNDMKKPAFFTKASLDTALNSIRYADTNYLKKDYPPSPFPNITVKDSLQRDTAAYVSFNKLPPKIRETIENQANLIDNMTRSYNGNRQNVIMKINTSVNRHMNDMQSYRDKLSLNFQSYSLSSAVDKDKLFAESIDIYRTYVQSYRNALDQMSMSLQQSDQYNTIEYSRLLTELKMRITNYVPDSNMANVYFSSFRFSDYPSDYLPSFTDFDYNIRTSKRDGSDWGPFGLIARYLIKTESLDLVLLIGMLGFGLLGAAISSFQVVPKEVSNIQSYVSIIEDFKTKPIITNFWATLARGFSAAILIYLATKGGIAILTSNLSADPNGYILLLLCFISAVFSEKVWNLVKTKFSL